MKSFTRLPPTVQKRVALCVGFVVAGAGAAASWTLHQHKDAAQRRLETSLANRAAMTALVQRYEAHQPQGSAALDLSAIVTRSLQGKSFQPSQIQQQNGELALRLDRVAFADVLEWMAELADAGVVFSNVGVAQAIDGVNLTLVLRGA